MMLMESVDKSHGVTRIYACATIWHETREEMMDLLVSILRMDEDQCARRVAQRYLGIVDPDYYELETHIFLDDAFDIDEVGSRVNKFVIRFITTIDKAILQIHGVNERMKLPIKIPTPYGGRMIWILPGNTKMFVHLKDQTKIRIKKRWSQVMYMHYLLGHHLMELPITEEQKKIRAKNTYLLTLDGDVSFKPDAVQQLIDLMKKNDNIGAACGRLHPVGKGPIVWYQAFEYALGHWLQKATENLIGCVLCSPGCFSLYRGLALMDDNVIHRYTEKSQKARHYVQFDQGEDRWLCTLLLQGGYRVEYSAFSDANTHCPQNFSEFFNQRRRWITSTAANILDFLINSKHCIRFNYSDIFAFYVIYQFILMVCSIMGFGAVFLMMIDTFTNGFHADVWTSFYFHTTLTASFVLICFNCKSQTQLLAGKILSTLYGLIFAVDIVDKLLRVYEGNIGPAMYLIFLLSTILIAGLLHPREMSCIFFIFIYLIFVPCTYYVLILYSIINLNNVSWGTREIPTEDSIRKLQRKKKRTEHEAMLQYSSASLQDRDEEVSLSLVSGSSFDINDNHEEEPRSNEELQPFCEEKKQNNFSIIDGSHLIRIFSLSKTENNSSSDIEENKSHSTGGPDNIILTSWFKDNDWQEGSVTLFSTNENKFWADLINRCLYPLNEDKVEKERIAGELKDLRNLVVFVFFTINIFFVGIVFLLQVYKVQLRFEWPFAIKIDVSDEKMTDDEIGSSNTYLQLNPTDLLFVLYLMTQIIQFGGMIVERCSHVFGTLIKSLKLYCGKGNKKEATRRFSKEAMDLIKRLKRLQGSSGCNLTSIDFVALGQHYVNHNLEKRNNYRTCVSDHLNAYFRKRFVRSSA